MTWLLAGRSDSVHELEHFGKKFLGVGAGGTLELHGMEKMSWTKLAHTIPAALQVDCGVVYDHKVGCSFLHVRLCLLRNQNTQRFKENIRVFFFFFLGGGSQPNSAQLFVHFPDKPFSSTQTCKSYKYKLHKDEDEGLKNILIKT